MWNTNKSELLLRKNDLSDLRQLSYSRTGCIVSWGHQIHLPYPMTDSSFGKLRVLCIAFWCVRKWGVRLHMIILSQQHHYMVLQWSILAPRLVVVPVFIVHEPNECPKECRSLLKVPWRLYARLWNADWIYTVYYGPWNRFCIVCSKQKLSKRKSIILVGESNTGADLVGGAVEAVCTIVKFWLDIYSLLWSSK